MSLVSPSQLKEQIIEGKELAVVDVRSGGAFAGAHLLYAISIPLANLELELGRLIPRSESPIVLCDDASGLSDAAAVRLTGFGYTQVNILDGGIEAWQNAGYEIFSGVNVPSKAFGEFVEHEYGTPRLPAEEIKAKLDAGENIVILDSRPMKEFTNMSIPGAICCPGAELVYRVCDAVDDPQTLVVVNCAGRTRSIIGSQSLINAGIPNPVVALKNGTMGWHLAGYGLDHGQVRPAPNVTENGLERSRKMADTVAKRFGVERVSCADLERFRTEKSEITLFVLDVRSPEEYAAGHLPGSRSAPGGQLVQATDEYVGVRNSRLVLIDDTGVRATMTASWLIQMGWDNVYVLDGILTETDLETGPEKREVLGLENLDTQLIKASALNDLITKKNTVVIDLSDSLEFRAGHIPGARRASRTGLEEVLGKLTGDDLIFVLTSPDGILAKFAADEVSHREDLTVYVLDGGFEAWADAGYALESGDDPAAGELSEDVWYKPYEQTDAIEEAMHAYLTWEVALVEQIERDGTTCFRRFHP
jgi:rhodanese-related sulfurtransferase